MTELVVRRTRTQTVMERSTHRTRAAAEAAWRRLVRTWWGEPLSPQFIDRKGK